MRVSALQRVSTALQLLTANFENNPPPLSSTCVSGLLNTEARNGIRPVRAANRDGCRISNPVGKHAPAATTLYRNPPQPYLSPVWTELNLNSGA